jgi:HemY protein
MRFIVWLALIALSAVIAAWLFTINHGHVTLYWNQYRVDLSMNLFMILGFSTFLVIFYFFKIISTLIELPLRAKQYRLKQLELRSFQELKNATEHLFAGRYAKAIKSAQESMNFKDTLPVASMLAAQASHHLKQYDERDHWLAQIDDSENQNSKLILKAQMLIEQRRAGEALEVLNQLQKGGSRQFLAQSLAMRAYQIEQNWPQMLKIAGSLLKKNYLPPSVGRASIHEALSHWVSSGRVTKEELLKQWDDLGEDGQKNLQWVKLFAQGLLVSGNPQAAKDILDRVLGRGAQEELLAIYPQCGQGELGDQFRLPMMQRVEDWIKKEPAHPALHLALGEICQSARLWGKALVSLQTVHSSPRSTLQMKLKAQLGMMRVYDALENPEKSATHQKEALRIFTQLFPQY